MRTSDFERLKVFAAVAERGSFVKAAGALGLSTSSVSQSVRALEDRLGLRLLNRTTRSVALTEYGVYFDGFGEKDAAGREHGTNWLMDRLGESLKD